MIKNRGEIAGGGLEVLASATLLFGRGGLGLLQVSEIRVADSAADGLQMEVQVLVLSTLKRAEQVRSELAASRTAQAVAPPDFADGDAPLIRVPCERGQLLTQRL